MLDPSSHAAVFDRSAATYDAVGVEFFAAFGKALVRRIGVQHGETVLDIGTGRGAVLRPAAAAVGQGGRVVGVDLAPTMVSLTAAEFSNEPHVTVHTADAQCLPDSLPADMPIAYDVVLSSLVIFFMADPAAALAGWTRCLRPGGRLGLATFVDDPDDGWFEQVAKRWFPDMADSDDDEAPSAFTLVRDTTWLDGALARAGLTDISATVIRHPVRFTSVEQWWNWAWSHGMRAALEVLTPEDHDAFRSDVEAALDIQRLPDGSRGFHTSIRLTTARRAGGSS